MSGYTTHIDPKSEELKKSMELCRQELLADGWREDDQGFKSLMALHEYLETTPKEELEREWKEIEESGVGANGPTVEEYFQGINPQYQYEKGYREGAGRLKSLLEEKFKDNKEVLESIQQVWDNN